MEIGRIARAWKGLGVGVVVLGCAAWAPPGPSAPPVTLPGPASPATPAPSAPPTQLRVVFDGNHDLTSQELLGALDGRSDLQPALGSSLVQAVSPRAVAVLDATTTLGELRIDQLYYDRGYLSVRVDPPEVRVSPDAKVTVARFHIDEGPRYRVGSLAIDERDPEGRVVRPLGPPLDQRMTLKAGDWFSRAVIVGDLGAIRTGYRDAGYANVAADPETELHPETSPPTVSLRIAVRRGPIVLIDRVVVRGNARIPTDTLRAIIGIAPGKPFGETKLEDARRRLLATGELASVDVMTEPGPNPAHVTTTFEVVER